MKHSSSLEKTPTWIVLPPVQSPNYYMHDKSPMLNNEVIQPFELEAKADCGKLKRAMMMLGEEKDLTLEAMQHPMSKDDDVNATTIRYAGCNFEPYQMPTSTHATQLAIEGTCKGAQQQVHQTTRQCSNAAGNRRRKPARREDGDSSEDENEKKKLMGTQASCQKDCSKPKTSKDNRCSYQKQLADLYLRTMCTLNVEEMQLANKLLFGIQHVAYCQGRCKNGKCTYEKIPEWIEATLKLDTDNRRVLVLMYALIKHALDCTECNCPVKLCSELRDNLLLYERQDTCGQVLYSNTSVFEEGSLVIQGLDWWHVCPNKVGRGATGEVFEGLLVADGNFAAVVVKKAIQKAIKKEAKFAHRLNGSANILAPQVIIEWITLGQPRPGDKAGVIIMERGVCSLSDLLQLWKKVHGLRFSELRLKMAVYYMKMILNAVKELHDKGLLHRDIKNQNVIVFDLGGTVKLADFDGMVEISQLHNEPPAGTPGFTAPEIFASYPPTLEADVYSCVKTFYELICVPQYFAPPKFTDNGRFMRQLWLRTIWRDACLDLSQVSHSILRRKLKLGVSRDPKKRPTVNEFAQFLDGLPCLTGQEVVDNISSLLVKKDAKIAGTSSLESVFIHRTKQYILRHADNLPARDRPLLHSSCGDAMDVDE